MPIIIVVDANILVSSPELRTPAWESLIERRSDWNIQFIVPEVALMETVKNVRGMWEQQWAKVKQLKVVGFGLGGDQTAWLDTIRAKIDSYEDDLRKRLGEISAEVVPPPQVDHMDLARRASEQRAPFSAKNKDCYRDALIWHSVLETAKNNPDSDVWFVSNNTEDFGPSSEDGGPAQLHADLTADLDSDGLLDRVRYLTKLHSLEQLLASQFAPLSSDDFQNLIELAALHEQFEAAVVSQSLRPRETALDPDAVAAIVTTAAPDEGSWKFSSAAQRGSDGWSARYTVTATATYTSSDASGKLSIGRKKLVFNGDIAVASDKSIAEFSIESVDALPDDPDRALWPDSAELRQMTQAALDSADGAYHKVVRASGIYDTGQFRIAEALEQELAEMAEARRRIRSSRQRLN